MKVRCRTTCQTCRSRKIGCDGKTPSCTQCLFRNVECPGYSSNWIFVPQNRLAAPHATPWGDSPALAEKKAMSNRAGLKSKRRGGKPATSRSTAFNKPDARSLGDLIDIILQGYVPGLDVAASIDETTPRICGAWAEVLPELVSNGANAAVASAIKAFALSILVGGQNPGLDKTAAIEAYSSALRSVSEAIQAPHGSSAPELVAAVMCLLFAELFLPTSLESWTTHLEGLGELMQTCRPEAYVGGIPHRLFVGARPALIVLGIQSRKPSFLARDEWRLTPFREICPSPVQALMSEAAIIPSILEKLDQARRMTPESSKAACNGALTELNGLLERLDLWATNFLSLSAAAQFWYEPTREAGRERIWFVNLTAANGLTHFWAFKAICLTNVERLLVLHPEMASEIRVAQPSTLEEMKQLSVMICQSVEYLMQGQMKLFGPTSVVLPLQTAYEIFRMGGAQTKDELNWCREILRVVFRGYHFLALFFDEFRN